MLLTDQIREESDPLAPMDHDHWLADSHQVGEREPLLICEHAAGRSA